MIKKLETNVEDGQLFYLTSRHGDCGSNVMFHNKGGAGYGTNLDNLQLYSREDAQRELDYDINSLPLLKSAVDEVSITAVDCQYLDSEANATDNNNEYVIQIEGCWNGNDIAFAIMGGKTFNYSEACVFTLLDAEELVSKLSNAKIWSKSYLDTISRRTFQRGKVNTRKMITGAGIKYKKPRKKKADSGKIRWNCPGCGKFRWQHNPYDFDGCSDSLCMEYKPTHC